MSVHQMRKEAILATSLLVLLIAALSATVYAQTSYSVYIMDPTIPANGAKGLSSNGYWVGQIPVRITSGSTTLQTVAYCKNFDKLIYIGSTYSATLTPVTDTTDWRAVSYILSWYAPADNNAAAVDQVALWRIIDSNYFREQWLDVNIDNAGAALANLANGKDVARQGDLFNWISPINVNMSSISANAGDTLTFRAQLTSSAGAPRANVKIQFTATLNIMQLNSTYVNPAETFTDSQGIAQVSIRVPADTALGSTLEVKASTTSVWPQRYVDLTNPDNQDLIGTDSTFGLTLSTNICVLGNIHVVPESAYGALSAIGAFAGAFVIWARIKKQKGPLNP